MNVRGLRCPPSSGELVIDNVSLNTPAWCALDLVPLWAGLDQRGADLLIPHMAGVYPFRRRTTVSSRILPMIFCGEVNHEGAPTASLEEGLQANVDYFRTYVSDPTNTASGLRHAELTMPNGEVRATNLHVIKLEIGDRTRGTSAWGGASLIMLATLELSIPYEFVTQE